MTQIFVPKTEEDEIILEVDQEPVFTDAARTYAQHKGEAVYKDYEFHGETYSVNIGNVRYHVLNRDGRRCLCCGIHATHMYLCRFEEKDNQGYNFRMYAENKDRPGETSHLVLMTSDHILPRSQGGANEESNLQCLCAHCNHLKNDSGMSIEDIRRIIFIAYRIYRGTLVLNKAKAKMEDKQRELEKCEAAIKSITAGLEKVKSEDAKQGMLTKRNKLSLRATYLREKIRSVEITAQTTGFEPQHISWEEA